jgi:hypothetical protein
MANVGLKLGAVLLTALLAAIVVLFLIEGSREHQTIVLREHLRALEKPPPPVTAPKGWAKIDFRGHFSLYAPPGSYHHPLRGDDSFVGQIVTPHFTLDFDFGLYSNDLREMASAPGHVETRFSAGGRPAAMHTVPNGRGFAVGAYVANVHCGRLIAGIRCDWDSLEIDGAVPDAAARDTADAMFRTLQFPGSYE